MRSTILVICLGAAVCLVAAAESKSDEQSKNAAKKKPIAADKPIGKEAGQVRDDNGLKMKLVWCPAGKFMMGDSGKADFEVPINETEVTLSAGYWLGKYEVTQAEWLRVTGKKSWQGKDVKEGDEFPVTHIRWEEAIEFCAKLTKQERAAGRIDAGWEYALPTEAQWERACRAGTTTRFSFGNDAAKLGDFAWFSSNTAMQGEKYPHRVGQKKPNPWGLHDMHGNVYEWCRDADVGRTQELPGGTDPLVEDEQTNGGRGVLRGGGWRSDWQPCRAAYRFGSTPDFFIGESIGFRVALARVRTVK